MVRFAGLCASLLLVLPSCSTPGRATRDTGTGGLDAPVPDAPTGTDDAPTATGDVPSSTGDAPDARTADAEASDATTDAPAIDAPGDAGSDAPASTIDAGCTPGASRPCTLMCMGGTTAPGRELCYPGDVWGPCERPSELCGNGLDDDGDLMIDEDCRPEGGCIWIHPQCQGLMTMNEWCAMAGLRLVAGRRCPVAGGSVVPLDATYGEYPLCCCDTVSMCVPACTGPGCASCVVWDEIQCCP